MKTITGRGRKILSRLFRVISVSAASLILQAWYGMPPPDDFPVEYGMPPPHENQETSIRGKVVSRETQEPIFGIKVSIEGREDFEYTDKDGRFYLYVPIRDEYKLKLEDVDGPAHGGLFKEQTWPLNQNDTYYTVLISMDLDT
jgi:hypothetical protein